MGITNCHNLVLYSMSVCVCLYVLQDKTMCSQIFTYNLNYGTHAVTHY